MSDTSSPLFTPPLSPQPDVVVDKLGRPAQGVVSSGPPRIPGLYYFPDFLTGAQSDALVEQVIQQNYFDVDNGRDQAVLFGYRQDHQHAGLPAWTQAFLTLAEGRLRAAENLLPSDVLDLLFPKDGLDTFQGLPGDAFTRQLILNCYQPGQGLRSHIDLPHKFLDGIMIFPLVLALQ